MSEANSLQDLESVVAYVCDSVLTTNCREEMFDPENIIKETITDNYQEIKDKNNNEVKFNCFPSNV